MSTVLINIYKMLNCYVEALLYRSDTLKSTNNADKGYSTRNKKVDKDLREFKQKRYKKCLLCRIM